ncbi:MAG: hypothetical protein ACTJH9_14095 [Pseudoalteromonas sp.]|uniref:hypothetical protein n=2 Tax=Pseudoalteromonas TaxID=53246 RepID=UPI003F95940B
MPLMRWLNIVLFSFFLAACGGGGSLEKEGGSLDGGDDGTIDEPIYTLSAQGYVKESDETSNAVTEIDPIDIKVTLLKNDEPVDGQRITFTLADDIGAVNVNSALTNSEGIATVELSAGVQAGAGEITATFVGGDGDINVTERFAFTSSGGQGGNAGIIGSITLELSVVDQNNQRFTETNPVSKDNKGQVIATLKDDGEPLSEQLISFNTNFTGKIIPELGTALTNENGLASVTLSSGDLKGAGQVIASYQAESGETITKIAGFISSGDDASVETALANIDIKLLKDCTDGWDANRNNTSLEQSLASSGCEIVNQFSSDELIDVLVKVTDNSSGDGFSGIISEVSTDLGRLLPDSGKALTDNFGFALLKLQPGANSGAGEITAASKSASSQKAFEISTAELNIDISNGLFNKLDASGNPIEDEYLPLAAGATTVITIEIFDTEGNSVVSPLDVEFTSGCVQAGLSVMDQTATSISGIATTTYRTNGCSAAQGDTVTATVLTGGAPIVKSINIPVSTAPIESIEFIDATESVIALKGTGGQARDDISEITFKLKDKIGQDVKSSRIDFRLSSTNGAISLSHPSVVTDGDGLARVQVIAGYIPMAVRVQACFVPDDQIPENQNDNVTCWQNVYAECQKSAEERDENVACPAGELSLLALDEQVITVSDLVSISSGLPDGNSFTAGAETINIEGLDSIGDINEVSVYLADHFNNPVPDGTAVYLTTEGGAIGTLNGSAFDPQLECRTIDGQCNAQWRNQNPKPFTDSMWNNRIDSTNPRTNQINCDSYFGVAAPCINGINNAAENTDGVPLGGRITVLATAKGQESFIDINGNGRFDTNEYFSGYDLTEAYVDHNENGKYDGLAAIYDPVTAQITKEADFCREGDTGDPCSPVNTNGGHFEESFDIDLNEMHTLADGKYNGLLCTEQATNPPADATFASLCEKDLVDIRESFQIILSGSTVYSRFVVSKEDLNSEYATQLAATGDEVKTDNAEGLKSNIENCKNIYTEHKKDGDKADDATTVLRIELSSDDNFCDVSLVDLSTGGVNALESLRLSTYYSDRYNNPIPEGTSVSIATTNGKYDGRDSFNMLETSRTTAASESFTISRETDPNDASTGLLTVTFDTPKGVQTVASLTINDDG